MVGSPGDRDIRQQRVCVDGAERRTLVESARKLIYKDGYVVNSDKVEQLLKPESLVPLAYVADAGFLAHLS